MTTASPRHLEGIAREIHDEYGERPIDAIALAGWLGFSVRYWGKGIASLSGKTISLPSKSRNVRQQFLCAHELGHALLARAGADHRDEDAADYLACALLLPRPRFERDLAETDWNLFELQARHPNAPMSTIAQRMCQLSPASATVWDGFKLTHAYGAEVDLEADRALVDEVLGTDRPVRAENEAAWPVLDGVHRRVVVVRRAA